MSSRLRSLFDLNEDEMKALAAEIQGAPDELFSITGDEWLELFGVEGKPAALAAVCAIALEHLPPPRLSLEQCILLACRDSAPVAEMGLKLAQRKPLQNGAAVLCVMGLGRAASQRVRQDGVQWAIQVLERSPHSRMEHLRELFNAPHEDVRRQAAAVMTRSLRFKDALELWAALARSPYEDARSFLLLHLTRRKSGLPPGTSRHLWATTIIALARVQGEVKRAVIDRAVQYAATHPEESADLLPLLEIMGVDPPPPASIRM